MSEGPRAYCAIDRRAMSSPWRCKLNMADGEWSPSMALPQTSFLHFSGNIFRGVIGGAVPVIRSTQLRLSRS